MNNLVVFKSSFGHVINLNRFYKKKIVLKYVAGENSEGDV